MNLRGEYTKRRDVMLEACEKYLGLPGGVVSWSETRSGMFVSSFSSFSFFFLLPLNFFDLQEGLC